MELNAKRQEFNPERERESKSAQMPRKLTYLPILRPRSGLGPDRCHRASDGNDFLPPPQSVPLTGRRLYERFSPRSFRPELWFRRGSAAPSEGASFLPSRFLRTPFYRSESIALILFPAFSQRERRGIRARFLGPNLARDSACACLTFCEQGKVVYFL